VTVLFFSQNVIVSPRNGGGVHSVILSSPSSVACEPFNI
jgi:hypothetical protein